MSVQPWNDDEYFLTTRPGPELQPLTHRELEREETQRRAETYRKKLVVNAITYHNTFGTRYWDD